ncbi:MAG TPA: SCO family protein [Solirubrobacteraceae bacterium]|jgi:protein SCO1/2|nr:SCO family protein [Solirubrobacteraceae bacterium]
MAEQTEPAPKAAPRSLTPRRRRLVFLAIVVIAVAAAGITYALTSSSPHGIYGTSVASTAKGYEGLAETKAVPEPPLKLNNYLGQPINLLNYRGKAVLVTFIYDHCPDTCPLMVSHLHTALTLMPASERAKLQIIAVSVDPRGDTPKTVAAFLHLHLMTGRMLYLIGSRKELESTWANWGISAGGEAGDPDVVEHTALVYGITGHGKVAVVYASNFTPAEIVHDARILATA